MFLLVGLKGNLGLFSMLQNSKLSPRVRANLSMSSSRSSLLGRGGVGTKLRPLLSTESSLSVSVWEDRLTTLLLVASGTLLCVCAFLLCLVLWLRLTNLRKCVLLLPVSTLVLCGR